ncbi:glycogen-binding domain-containing protein [Candidatus Bipolaricaulota bacterium]|nr:glycogen-binding domain-containing protein [Candidatus Bipolaricaulota bacterium]
MRRDDLDRMIEEQLVSDVQEEIFRIDGLEDRIVTEISNRLPRRGGWERLKELFIAPVPRKQRLKDLLVVGATAVIFLIFGVALGGRLADRLPDEAVALLDAEQNGVVFALLAIGAQEIQIAGTFNSWEKIPLIDADGDGIWTVSIELAPGRHEYAFIIDGRWFGQDPMADDFIRSFGYYNSVRYIGVQGDDV